MFGQYERDDDRFIPFTLADQGSRGNEPLLIALEHLLRLPDSRLPVSEVLDLLDVAALRRRFGIQEADLPGCCVAGLKGPGCAGAWTPAAGPAWACWQPGAEHLALLACAACCWAMPWAPV
ncbi:exodeoxyribonuclease V subunit gamma, partial [Oceanimonas sp. NS1]|nr:exodeoxyribonuclease V subunit gamma [Oceanimonas sp. NS1]